MTAMTAPTEDERDLLNRMDLGLHKLLAGERIYHNKGPAPMGWRVTISQQPLNGDYILVGKCSCGFTSRFGDDDAWERVTENMGVHVKSVHLRK